MGNDKYEEHPLDSWLDAESEEEFGAPEIRDRFDPAADVNTAETYKSAPPGISRASMVVFDLT